MARKPKRMSKKELKQPDEVEVALKGLWTWIEDHWKWLVAGAVALVVLGAAWSVTSGMRRTGLEDRADNLSLALSVIAAPVEGQSTPALPVAADRETFATVALARKTAAERLDAFLADHAGSDAAVAAELARAALPSDDAAAQAARLDAWLTKHGDLSLATTARFTLAQQWEHAGERDRALATYQQVADGTKGTLRAMALMAIGDLHNPLASSAGNAAKAREAYTAARDTLGPRPAPRPDDILALSLGQPYIFTELANKLALLE